MMIRADDARRAHAVGDILMKRKVSRRQMVKSAIVVGGAVGGAAAAALRSGSAPTTTASATARSESTTQSSSITSDDVAAFERMSGRAFAESERKAVAGRLAEVRATLRRVRSGTIGPDVEPAIHFDPRPAGF